MTPALVQWLQSDEAAPWLEALAVRPLADADLLPTLERPPPPSAAGPSERPGDDDAVAPTGE